VSGGHGRRPAEVALRAEREVYSQDHGPQILTYATPNGALLAPRRFPGYLAGDPERKRDVLNERESNPPVSTGRGDDGTTTLLGSGRMPKHDPRIVVLGDVDEASSFLGLARAEADGEELGGLLIECQRLLYRVMGDVAMPKEDNAVGEEDLKLLDEALEEWRGRTEIPKEFVVPGESRLGALLDVARSVVRRAERSLVAAGYASEHPYAVRVVNRLSDLLFILARNADGEKTLSKG